MRTLRFPPLILLMLSLLIGFWPGSAQAEMVKRPHISVGLVAEMRSAVRGQTVQIGILQQIESHWHTYWRNPGDSGLPPKVKWTLPKGVTVSAIQWPLPKRIRVKHLANFGYEKRVLLPLSLTIPPSFSEKKLTIVARLDWLVCQEEECIPGKATLTLSLDISAAPPKDGPYRELFVKTRQQLPRTLDGSKVTLKSEGKQLRLTLPGKLLPAGLSGFELFPISKTTVHNAAPQKSEQKNGSLQMLVQPHEYFAAAGNRFNGLLVATLKGRRVGWRFETPLLRNSPVKKSVVVHKPPPVRKPLQPQDAGSVKQLFAGWSNWDKPQRSSGLWKLLEVLLFALVGGLALNLMPCVFPVLSIKILHFMEKARSDQREVRRHGLAFVAGVQLSFTALAGTLIALRSGGSLIGWGFQLQLPHVVFVLAAVLFVLGLSLSGLFEVGDSLMNLGSSLASKKGLSGSFFTGVLATVVATPCTAPLMGAAIAYALTQPAWVGLLVFNVLGLGMALPYLLLAFFPAALKWLPKPGAWMETFKQFMAFPMYAAALWLLWVLGKQAGTDGIITASMALLGLGFAGWIYGRARDGGGRRRVVGLIVALLLGGVASAYGISGVRQDAHRLGERTKAQQKMLQRVLSLQKGPLKQNYSRTRLARLMKERKNVFLNLTAAWCISCKVNEQVALRRDSVQAALKRHNVVYMVGDWTHRDAEIARVLEHFGRHGVPLYVLLHGKSRRYMVLPQILTPGIVVEALDKLK